MTVTINPQTVSVSLNPSTMGVLIGNPIARDEREAYDGDYVVTPTQETQTLQTINKRMTGNVVVKPIPSNYGKITWNGSILTVS